MTDQAQDVIVGRTVLDLSAERKKLACLESEAKRMGESLEEIGKALRTLDLPTGDQLTEGFPEKNEVTRICDEVRLSTKRVSDLAATVRKMAPDI